MEISRHILAAIEYLQAAYPAWKGTASTAAVWQDILGHLSEDAVQRGVRAYVASGAEFAPNPGQILQAARMPAPEPLEAWGEVQSAVCNSSPYGRNVEWSHPLIARAVAAIGGFSMLERELGETTRAAFRARFVDCMTNLPDHEASMDTYELAQSACGALAGSGFGGFLRAAEQQDPDDLTERRHAQVAALGEKLGYKRRG